MHSTGEYGSWWARAINVFTYFTIMSNVIVAVTSAMLAANPRRFSDRFAVWRLTGIVAITITGVVYNTILAQYAGKMSYASALANNLEHRIVPVLTVLGWLFFGPRLPFKWRTIGWGVVIGLAWLTFTMIRGLFPVANQNNSYWYPYPFLDASNLGYATVIVNCLAILALFVVLAAIVLALDKVLPGPRPEEAAPISQLEPAS